MYKKLLLRFILPICTIVLFIGCSSNQSIIDNSVSIIDETAKEEKPVDIEKDNEVKEDNLESIANNSVLLMSDLKYTLYPGPQPDSLSVEIINGGINVQITEESDDWIKVKYSGGEGWIPKWYVLSEESNQIIDIQSEEKVLNQDISGSLYPNGPKIVDLNKGKLLKPFREWNGWYEVKIIVYDIPAVQSAWVPQNLLSSVNEIQPIEGYLPKGTEVYEIFEFEKISSTNSNSTTYDMNVYIISKRNVYILVGAGGGWSAWTKQQNLIYTLVK